MIRKRYESVLRWLGSDADAADPRWRLFVVMGFVGGCAILLQGLGAVSSDARSDVMSWAWWVFIVVFFVLCALPALRRRLTRAPRPRPPEDPTGEPGPIRIAGTLAAWLAVIAGVVLVVTVGAEPWSGLLMAVAIGYLFGEVTVVRRLAAHRGARASP